MSVCDTLLPAGPHWQARVIPVTFPEPSHFIRTVINHCWNNVVAWNTGVATSLRRRASAARGLVGTCQSVAMVKPLQHGGPSSHCNICWHLRDLNVKGRSQILQVYGTKWPYLDDRFPNKAILYYYIKREPLPETLNWISEKKWITILPLLDNKRLDQVIQESRERERRKTYSTQIKIKPLHSALWHIVVCIHLFYLKNKFKIV